MNKENNYCVQAPQLNVLHLFYIKTGGRPQLSGTDQKCRGLMAYVEMAYS